MHGAALSLLHVGAVLEVLFYGADADACLPLRAFPHGFAFRAHRFRGFAIGHRGESKEPRIAFSDIDDRAGRAGSRFHVSSPGPAGSIPVDHRKRREERGNRG